MRVEIDAGKGLRTLLPPSPEKAEVVLPDTAPPFDPGLRQTTVVRRVAAGPIEVSCEKCSPDEKTLVPMNGRITLGQSFRVEKFDFTQREMRIHFTDTREGPFHTGSTYEADLVTPWTNVTLVERVSTPDRAFGVKLIMSAAVAGVLGGVALGDGLGTHTDQTTVLGAAVLPIAALLAIAGGWYALAPPEDHVLFRGH
jgi:hypothetical protein